VRNVSRSSIPCSLTKNKFTVSDGGTLKPVWDFTSSNEEYDSSQASVVAAKDASLSARGVPNGLGSVAWLRFHGTAGELATGVYSVATKGGQPPVSCQPGSEDIIIKYTSQYCKRDVVGSRLTKH
jgi:hypothetical protein